MGSVMAIHGGYNTESRQTYDDLHLFDVEQKEWIRCVVALKEDTERNIILQKATYTKPQNTN